MCVSTFIGRALRHLADESAHPVCFVHRRSFTDELLLKCTPINQQTCLSVQGGLKKSPTRQNAICRQSIELFYQNFRIYSRRNSQQSLKISLKYFHCFKNCSFYDILFRISKSHRRNGQTQSRIGWAQHWAWQAQVGGHPAWVAAGQIHGRMAQYPIATCHFNRYMPRKFCGGIT